MKGGENVRRRTVLQTGGAIATLGITGLSGCLGGSSGDFPSGTITNIVPYGTGGGTDAYARQISNQLSEELDVTVEVENMSGAGTLRGVGELVNSESDGHTFASINIPHTPTSLMVQEPDFNARDLKAIAAYATDPNVIFTHPDDGVEDFDDLMSRYASGEFTTLGGNRLAGPHLIAYVMKNQFGMEWDEFVGYDGTGPVLQGVASGDVDAGMGSDAAAVGPEEAGNLDVIAILHTVGSEAFPDVPTFDEISGYDPIDSVGGGVRGFYYSPDVDDEIRDRMEDAVAAALESDAVNSWAEEAGRRILSEDGETLQGYWDSTFSSIEDDVDLDDLQSD